ncbi:MAG: hypothetical protein MR896_08545 [Clostridiales bacterium]|nr:hypothetical protein [Clostridiales bacterium]
MQELMRDREKNHRAGQSDGRRQTKKRETVKGGNPSDFTLYSRPKILSCLYPTIRIRSLSNTLCAVRQQPLAYFLTLSVDGLNCFSF